MNPDKLKIIQDQPVDFIELAFNESLWSKQKEIVNSIRDNPRTTVKSCFDTGKSFISSRIAIWFLYSFFNSKVITTAPTFRQVKDILWRELHVAKNKSRLMLGGQLNDTSLNLGDNWFAMGFSSDKPTNFQGFHSDTGNVLVIGDEAAGMDEKVFNSLEGLLTSGNARLLYIGNPTNIEGTFFQSFRLPNYNHISISAFDTPNFTTFGISLDDIRRDTWQEKITAELPAPYLVTPSWVHGNYIKWGEQSPMFQALVLGEFPEQGENTLIPLSKIEQAVLRTIEPLKDDPENTGVDVARFGSNKTIFILRKGAKTMEIKEFSHMDTVQTSGHLSTYLDTHPFSSASIDEVGVGGGVVDIVKKNQPYKTITGVNVGLPASDPERFFNLRAELYVNLRERFINNDISIPNDEELKAQLSSIQFEFTPKGQYKIETKEEMSKRGLPSPDKADALSLAFGNVRRKPNILSYMQGMVVE